ncbi:MAG: SDR family oxidoreductase [Acidobacteriota bacterium]
MHVRELFELSGKTALVTGGSRGLGLEIASGLGEAGAAVVITARRQPWLDEAACLLREQGVECRALACDVSQPEQVHEVVRQVVEDFGQIHILVNNAGVVWGAPAEEMPLEKWRLVMDVNLTGAFLMSRETGKKMIENQGGKIINITSISGLRGSDAQLMDAIGYSASKGGMISFTRDLAVKWARHSIQVNAIAPGFFPTRMSRPLLERAGDKIVSRIPMGRTGRPGELKGVTVFLASSASSYVTGQVIVVDGGATAW